MSKKHTVIAEKIHLQEVRILKSHFEVLESYNDEEISSVSMGFKSESGFNTSEKSVKFKLFIKINGQNDKEEDVGIFGEYQLEFYFIIDNLEEFIHREEGAEENDFTASENLGATIAGIAYSTSRGIILDRTQSTNFNGVLLPIVNPSKLLREDSFTVI